MIGRLITIQGWAGLAAAAALLVLLVVQKAESRRWRKQSAQYEHLYRAEQTAFAATVSNYRAAAEAARAADRAAAERLAAEQRAINERTAHDFEARLAAARAAADRLRSQAGAAAADPGRGGAASVPALSNAPGEPSQAAGEDRLSLAERLTATEQAIQLDELIKWVRRQASVRPNDER